MILLVSSEASFSVQHILSISINMCTKKVDKMIFIKHNLGRIIDITHKKYK